ncbi:hypothetical protein MJA45_07130 [Paenibacillus aurantius]|uniref:Uncharacterized protein n=1 Tax=Paenibacillus aurantius TaxID=2918900 RepID=A0AA96LGX7_9BACL|nr:hypothetical protein [Paenibacillus aurantius]WJH32402.1 hypothetical protein N6H14_18620 [Paenibacillus sp. CC-CFT747]WNQ12798.1 hypothetical protein MJA45_07130 [Paenibacillus aurantius]
MKRLLDLRFLIGLLFVLYGIILGIYGLAVNPRTVVGWNLNFWWGLLILAVGLGFLIWSRFEESED